MPTRRLSGWGRYPVEPCTVARPGSPELIGDLIAAGADAIPRGNGRAYGDAALNPAGVIDMRRLDRMLAFDDATGELVCEGGLLLAELIDALLPRGWFPPVTPGTKLVTVGGMIAADVHGKNHHGAGSFCDHVRWIDLDTGAGVIRCSADEHPDLFAATCGGMGLTGVIVRACVRLLKVETAMVRQRTLRARDLAEAMDLFERSLDWTYSVAWIDCLARGRDLGRSAILLGEHALAGELSAERRFKPFERPVRRAKSVPVDMPGFVLGRTPVKLFNRLYYAVQRPGDRLVEIDPYFYPLDALNEWNRIYGRRGFVQYQCVLPLAESARGLTRMLEAIAAEGQASFLAVLKRLGRQSFGLLSFPMEGYTLALDFPASAPNLALLDRLDRITMEHGGRLYLAKDARAAPAMMAAGYPRLDAFRAVRHAHGLDRRFSSLLSRRLEI